MPIYSDGIAVAPSIVRELQALQNLAFKSGTAFLLTLDHAITAARTLTIPDATDTLVTLALAQTLASKTLTAPVINGVVTTTGLTLPAFTLGGTLNANGNNILSIGDLTASVLKGGGATSYIKTFSGDGAVMVLQARDTGVGDVEIARQQGAAEPRLGYTLPLNLRTSSTLTIAAGVITVGVAAAAAWYVVNGEGAAADNLDTINGGATGDRIVLVRGDANITLRDFNDSAGNIAMGGAGVSFVLDNANDYVELFHNGTRWVCAGRESNG